MMMCCCLGGGGGLVEGHTLKTALLTMNLCLKNILRESYT